MKFKYLLVTVFFFLITSGISAQPEPSGNFPDSLQYNLQLLKRYLSEGDKWYFTDPQTEKRLSGLIHFIENEPIDSIINRLKEIGKKPGKALLIRFPKDDPDTLTMPGYVPYRQLVRQLNSIEEEITREYQNISMVYPPELFEDLIKTVPLIPEGQGMQLFTENIYTLPDSLRVTQGIAEERIQKPEDFRRILNLDSIRSMYVEKKRIHYNDSLLLVERNRIMTAYRQQKMQEQITLEKNRRIESVKLNNNQVAGFYNNQVIIAVNDSLVKSAQWLTGFADYIDNTTVNLVNLTHASSPLVLSNAGRYFTRIWLKNRQNDSISVLVQSIDKHNMQLVIEDQEIFSRFERQSVDNYDFSSLNRAFNIEKVGRRYLPYAPWTIGGTGTTGFTQTYLSNWKKGGKSALSVLIMMKGFVNYTSDKFRWENSAELRNGWIKPGAEAIQKNDDKVELISRFGITAFQKWYYSTEVDFETQLFYGYAYPDVTHPVSGYLSPGKFLFKIGMDYKPTKEFSLLISPITSKLVFVRDTVKINKASYKISPGKTSYWEPGLNTDLSFKKSFNPVVSFETKYRMFINYLRPFRDVDIYWENNLTVRFTANISMQVLTYSIYDSKVLFDKLDREGNPLLDANGKKIMEPRLQIKEFFTIGFNYRINKRVVRAKEIT